MRKMNGQQEMVGFVLIVVLVIVALMIFVIISVRKVPDEQQHFEVENMLSAILSYTTNCAIVFEPQFDSVEDLIKSCYDNERCNNLDRMACDYLNEIMGDIMVDLIASESVINAYSFDVFYRADGVEEGFWELEKGNCSGKVQGASVPLAGDGGDLVVRLRICKES